MHRLIVSSATYRQSSAINPPSTIRNPQSIDPRNLMLSRQERFRVEAEIVRDAALSASGLLNARIGGPSVRPPQPDGVYAFTQNRKNWTHAWPAKLLACRPRRRDLVCLPMETRRLMSPTTAGTMK